MNIDYWKRRYRQRPGDSGAGSEPPFTTAKADYCERFLRPGMKVLDFGCGNRNTQNEIRRRVPGIEWTSFDPAIAEYASTIPGFGFQGEVRFDAILALEVLEHVVDRRAQFQTALSLWLMSRLLIVTQPLHSSGGSHIDITGQPIASVLLASATGAFAHVPGIFGSPQRQTMIIALEQAP